MATPDLHEGKGLVLSSFEPGFRTSVGVVKATLIAASIATAAVAAPDTGLPAGGVADSSSFVEVGRYGSSGTPMGGWNDADLSCALQFPNGPIKARYFKIQLADIYFSATLFDFWEVHEPGLEAPSITFDRVEAGYGPVDARAVELSNTGKAGAAIESVRLDSDEAFEIVEQGAQSIDAGDVDRSWKLAPKIGLSAGSYRTMLRVASIFAGAALHLRQRDGASER